MYFFNITEVTDKYQVSLLDIRSVSCEIWVKDLFLVRKLGGQYLRHTRQFFFCTCRPHEGYQNFLETQGLHVASNLWSLLGLCTMLHNSYG